MKNKLLFLMALLLSTTQIAQADQTDVVESADVIAQTDQESQIAQSELSEDTPILNSTNAPNRNFRFFNQMVGNLLYGYMNFKFNSSSNGNYNNYEGHSNLYSVGADLLKLTPTITGGVHLFKVDTSLNTQILLAPAPISSAHQLINNNTIFAHAMKIFSQQVAVDLAGGYGENRVTTNSLLFPGLTFMSTGFANYHNANWFVSANALFNHQWGDFYVKGSVGSLYSQINTGAYLFTARSIYANAVPSFNVPFTQTIPSLATKTTYLVETAELDYVKWPKFMPFFNVSLLQVLQFSNSRPIVVGQINGTLPELNLNQNAYKFGGGFVFVHKQFRLRVEEKYYNAGSLFTSTQTLVGLEYQFS